MASDQGAADKCNLKRCLTEAGRRIANMFWRVVEPLKAFDGMMFLTSVLAFIAFLQWLTFKNTDETLRTNERAWIAAFAKLEKEDFSQVRISYENVGKSAAIGFVHHEN